MIESFYIFNYAVKNKANNEVDIYVDGDIVSASTQQVLKDWFGDETSVSFKSLRNQIEEANAETINLYVNSLGGHVGDAMAIHDYLKQKESKGVKINRKGIGIVASAATYLLMGDNSEMSENSWFGIHNIQSLAFGDIKIMKRQVENAEKFNNGIIDFYANKTGKPKEEIAKWMDDETWFSANEAKQMGFIKNVTGQTSYTNKIDPEKWQYKNKEILQLYNSFTNINPIFMDISKLKDTVENGFKNLMEKLGLNKPENTNEEVTNAYNEFADNIINAIKEIKVDTITEERIGELIAEGFKNLAKDLVDKNMMRAEMDKATNTLSSEITKLAGNQTPPPDVAPPEKRKVTNKKNSRYSGVTESDFGVSN